MTGRPDYDVGNLVVCLKSGESVRKGQVFLALELYPPFSTKGKWPYWLVRLSDVPYPPGATGHQASYYRKLDPKPPEFWTGTVDEPVKVDA